MNATIKYLKWLKGFNPLLYNAVMVMRPEIKTALQSQGLGANNDFVGPTQPTAAPSWWQSVLTTVVDTAKSLVPVYQQKKVLDVQLDLARQGKPLLTNEQVVQAGTTHIQVDLPKDIQDEVIATTQAAKSGINWTTLALVGGAGFLLYQMSQKKGRR